MAFVYKLETWDGSDAPRQVGVSKTYPTADKARNASDKALQATDILNELGITKLSASAWVEEVNA